RHGAARPVGLLTVGREPRVACEHDADLLVAGGDLGVRRDDALAGLDRRPRVDPERLDAEVLADRRPPSRPLDVGDIPGLVALLGHVSPLLSSSGGSDVSFTFDAYASCRLAVAWRRSRAASADTVSSRTGISARRASIATRVCSVSPSPSFV